MRVWWLLTPAKNEHHRRMQLSDVKIRNHPTCAVQLHLGIQPDPGCGSLFWDVLFYLFVPLPPGLTVTLHNVSLQRVLRGIAVPCLG